MNSQVEIKRENENVVASFKDSVRGTIVATEPIESLLLPNEKITIKRGVFSKTIIKRKNYKKTTDLIIASLKTKKINSAGIEFTEKELKDAYGADADTIKIAKSFEKDKAFVEKVVLDKQNKLQVLIKTVYNRTTEHELEVMKDLLGLFLTKKTTKDKRFLNEKISTIVTTIAIRKYDNDFHGLWSKIYDRLSELTTTDIRKEFAEHPTKSLYENRLDYCLVHHKKNLLEALGEVILEI